MLAKVLAVFFGAKSSFYPNTELSISSSISSFFLSFNLSFLKTVALLDGNLFCGGIIGGDSGITTAYDEENLFYVITLPELPE